MRCWRAMAGVALLATAITCCAARADMADADAAFARGKFDAALKLYEAVPAASADHEAALRRQGAIHLYANRLAQAEAALAKALALDPKDTKAAGLMAELESRRGRFSLAADWSTRAGREAKASALRAFGDDPPYRVVAGGDSTRIPFDQTDPLPLVKAQANGKDGLFLIDTGGGDVVLDPEFAASISVKPFADTTGTFAGDKKGSVQLARLPRFHIGTFEVADLPVALIKAPILSAIAGGRPVAGIIGTGFLSRFRSTLDYAGGALILERSTTSTRGTPAIARIPFWLLGDHFIVAEGRLNSAPPSLFLVDTGLAGFAFTGPRSELTAAGIALPALPANGGGGIGEAANAPFEIRSLTLGDVKREHLQGLYGPFPASLETSLGSRVGGLISHAFFRPYRVTFDFQRMVIEIGRR
ncbi:MAG: tetratricopeptide repeat protein [Alphaproteobacteria bacterium]|nr:tetratricopeptide repeat protein [Alphaproteobacteria bacterium]